MTNYFIIERNEVPLCAFIILLLTRCYSVFAILDRRVYFDENLRKNYRVEDFLWSGSGDGENDTELAGTEEQPTWERTTTVFHTTTVISTSTIIYKSVSTVIQHQTLNRDCSKSNGSCFISPTPTIKTTTETAVSPSHLSTPQPTKPVLVPDQRYWLVTVLNVNTTNVDVKPSQLENQLARLYKIAFHRHQEGHLGLQLTNDTSNQVTLRSQYLQRSRRDNHDSVTVRIHNVSNGDALNILYSVRVSGVPVLATTAAHDMKLVSDAEVVAELGYPVLTKAEPYLKTQSFPNQDGNSEGDFLFLLISSICAALIAILFILLLFITVKKRKRKRAQRVKQIMNEPSYRGERHMDPGTDNAAFSSSENENQQEIRGKSSAHYRKTRSNAAQTDMNGLSDFKAQSRLPSSKPLSASSILSMPSVRDFPDSHLPEPLTSVLNTSSPISGYDRTKLSRHGSIGGEDPGVVGPMVWHIHRQAIEKEEESRCQEDFSSAESDDTDVRRMRKRFDRLLDDALSFYGSRRSSEEYIDIDKFRPELHDHNIHSSSSRTDRIKQFERRSQSAVEARDSSNELNVEESSSTRPRTMIMMESRKHKISKTNVEESTTWCRNASSNLARLHSRPLSAGPFHRPVIQPEFIFTDSQLSSADPAVPIISAIKQELEKIPEHEVHDMSSNLSKMKLFTSEDTP